MAVAHTVPREDYVATAGQINFPYSFPINDAGELLVYINSLNTPATLGTHYHVTGVGNPSGGNVVRATGSTAGETVAIVMNVTLAQGATFIPHDPFPVQTMNNALDHIARVNQMQAERLERVPFFLPGGSTKHKWIAPPVANQYLRWSADAQTIENTALILPEIPSGPLPNGIINLSDYGGIGDGVFDNAGAFAAAILACPVGGRILIPPGVWNYTGTIVINKAVHLQGSNQRMCILRPMTPNVPAIRIADAFVTVSDLFVERVVKPVAGGDGIVTDNGMSHTRLQRLFIYKSYRGVVLRCTDIGYCVEVDVSNSESHGWQFEYTIDGPVAGANQWFLVRCGSNANLGNGFFGANTTATTGIGPWFTDCISFHNAGVGFQFAGELGHSLFDVLLLRCLASGDQLGGIDFIGTYGEAHMIHDSWIEYVGRFSGIPQGFDGTLSVATQTGVGLRIGGDNRAGGINVVGGMVWNCSWAGVYVATAGIHIVGITCIDNGQAFDEEFGNRAGLVIDANRVGVSGCTFTQTSGANPQHFGIIIGEAVTTCDISPSNTFNGYGAITDRVNTQFATLAGMVPIFAPLGLAVAVGRVGLQLWNETTNDKKTLRVADNELQVVNNAESNLLMRLTDAGVFRVRRYVSGLTDAWTAAQIVLDASWGSTAVVSAVECTDQRGNFTVTLGGAGIAPNPSFVCTFTGQAWDVTPVVICVLRSGDQSLFVEVTAITLTNFTVQLIGTPTTGQVYAFSFLVMG